MVSLTRRGEGDHRSMAAALQRGTSAFEPRLPHAERVRGSTSKRSVPSRNGPGRCGMGAFAPRPVAQPPRQGQTGSKQGTPSQANRGPKNQGRSTIADEARIADLLKDFELEAIIHLAAETHVDRSIESARAFIQTNVVGTSVLLILRGSIGVTYHPVDRRGSFRDGIY